MSTNFKNKIQQALISALGRQVAEKPKIKAHGLRTSHLIMECNAITPPRKAEEGNG